MADGAAIAVPAFEIVPPRNHMSAGHGSKFFRTPNADKGHKIFDGVLVGALGRGAGEVGKPFDFGRHVGEALECLGGEESILGVWECGDWGAGHGVILLLIKTVIKSKYTPFF